jgi:hypothetical protein
VILDVVSDISRNGIVYPSYSRLSRNNDVKVSRWVTVVGIYKAIATRCRLTKPPNATSFTCYLSFGLTKGQEYKVVASVPNSALWHPEYAEQHDGKYYSVHLRSSTKVLSRICSCSERIYLC